MAEPETDRNRAIVEAVRETLATAIVRLPAGIEPALTYSLQPQPAEQVERDVEPL
jgi:hypothetical protein